MKYIITVNKKYWVEKWLKKCVVYIVAFWVFFVQMEQVAYSVETLCEGHELAEKMIELSKTSNRNKIASSSWKFWQNLDA